MGSYTCLEGLEILVGGTNEYLESLDGNLRAIESTATVDIAKSALRNRVFAKGS